MVGVKRLASDELEAGGKDCGGRRKVADANTPPSQVEVEDGSPSLHVVGSSDSSSGGPSSLNIGLQLLIASTAQLVTEESGVSHIKEAQEEASLVMPEAFPVGNDGSWHAVTSWTDNGQAPMRAAATGGSQGRVCTPDSPMSLSGRPMTRKAAAAAAAAGSCWPPQLGTSAPLAVVGPPPVLVLPSPSDVRGAATVPPSPSGRGLFAALLSACEQEHAQECNSTGMPAAAFPAFAGAAPAGNGAASALGAGAAGARRLGGGGVAVVGDGDTDSDRASGDDSVVRGPFNPDEDALIVSCVQNGLNWREIAERVDGRNNKQCRERYINHLAPGISKHPWTPAEDRVLLAAQSALGNRWAEIAKRLPGRAENSVKNRFKSADFRKQLLMLGITP